MSWLLCMYSGRSFRSVFYRYSLRSASSTALPAILQRLKESGARSSIHYPVITAQRQFHDICPEQQLPFFNDGDILNSAYCQDTGIRGLMIAVNSSTPKHAQVWKW